MAQAKVDTNTRRRDFLALTAAACTAVMAARPALASPPDDSALLALEEQFFEQHVTLQRASLATAEPFATSPHTLSDSSHGSAIETPMPRSIVRRENL